ncbi:MAG: hypothetical protein CL686_00610 [Candidatus Nitrosopelagicus sp.]|nr:hypothetical protein [Candidatus Nitrosopelagicus sp.]|tara:strand:- start:781 stop:1563 length:783 start_codon:yes stop_codon:yes gene_type:complete
MIKIISLIAIFLVFALPVAHAIPLSDTTGLKFTFPINTDGRSFIIDITANSDIPDIDFDKNEKSLTLFAESSINTNLLEIVIPTSLIGGEFQFFLDGEEISPKFSQGKNSIFITMEFSGVGKHEIVFQGTTYLEVYDVLDKIDYEISNAELVEITSNPHSNSLFFSLTNATEKGMLSLTLSDEVILPLENDEYLVTVDGKTVEYTIDNNLLYIPFTQNSELITIIGTYVVPEFHEVAPLVLASSLIGIIVLKKYRNLFVQ